MAQEQDTQHALLIPWGHFAQEIGLISGIEAVKLNQKVYEHTPQAKVIEFLVAILSGVKYLQDISLGSAPAGQGSGGGTSLGPSELGRLYRHQSNAKAVELGRSPGDHSRAGSSWATFCAE